MRMWWRTGLGAVAAYDMDCFSNNLKFSGGPNVLQPGKKRQCTSRLPNRQRIRRHVSAWSTQQPLRGLFVSWYINRSICRQNGLRAN
jgi:hypothetical protein